MAWQFDRPDLGQGAVQAFRRAKAPKEELTIKLQGLEPSARYEVANLDGGQITTTGEELMNTLAITLPMRPAAAVLMYHKETPLVSPKAALPDR